MANFTEAVKSLIAKQTRDFDRRIKTLEEKVVFLEGALDKATANRLLDMRGVLSLYPIGRSTVQAAVATGELPAKKSAEGGKLIFAREDVDYWFANRTTPRPSTLIIST